MLEKASAMQKIVANIDNMALTPQKLKFQNLFNCNPLTYHSVNSLRVSSERYDDCDEECFVIIASTHHRQCHLNMTTWFKAIKSAGPLQRVVPVYRNMQSNIESKTENDH